MDAEKFTSITSSSEDPGIQELYAFGIASQYAEAIAQLEAQQHERERHGKLAKRRKKVGVVTRIVAIAALGAGQLISAAPALGRTHHSVPSTPENPQSTLFLPMALQGGDITDLETPPINTSPPPATETPPPPPTETATITPESTPTPEKQKFSWSGNTVIHKILDVLAPNWALRNLSTSNEVTYKDTVKSKDGSATLAECITTSEGIEGCAIKNQVPQNPDQEIIREKPFDNIVHTVVSPDKPLVIHVTASDIPKQLTNSEIQSIKSENPYFLPLNNPFGLLQTEQETEQGQDASSAENADNNQKADTSENEWWQNMPTAGFEIGQPGERITSMKIQLEQVSEQRIGHDVGLGLYTAKLGPNSAYIRDSDAVQNIKIILDNGKLILLNEGYIKKTSQEWSILNQKWTISDQTEDHIHIENLSLSSGRDEVAIDYVDSTGKVKQFRKKLPYPLTASFYIHPLIFGHGEIDFEFQELEISVQANPESTNTAINGSPEEKDRIEKLIRYRQQEEGLATYYPHVAIPYVVDHPFFQSDYVWLYGRDGNIIDLAHTPGLLDYTQLMAYGQLPVSKAFIQDTRARGMSFNWSINLSVSYYGTTVKLTELRKYIQIAKSEFEPDSGDVFIIRGGFAGVEQLARGKSEALNFLAGELGGYSGVAVEIPEDEPLEPGVYDKYYERIKGLQEQQVGVNDSFLSSSRSTTALEAMMVKFNEDSITSNLYNIAGSRGTLTTTPSQALNLLYDYGGKGQLALAPPTSFFYPAVSRIPLIELLHVDNNIIGSPYLTDEYLTLLSLMRDQALKQASP